MKHYNYKSLVVLVTGVGGPTGQGVLQSLHKIKHRPKLLASDISSTATGFYWADKSLILPYSNDETRYIESVKTVCKNEGINVIIPGSDGEARVLAKHQKELTDIIVACSSNDIWNIVGDKYKLSLYCNNLGVKVPKSFVASKENAYKMPSSFVLKKREGSGSRGIKYVIDKTLIDREFDGIKATEYFIQEYLDTEKKEFTVGTYFDYNSQDYIDPLVIAYERTLYFGNTLSAITTDPKKFLSSITKLGKALNIKGYANFQFILKDNIPCLIDLNTRFSSSTSMALALGYNWVEIYLDNIFHNATPHPAIYDNGVVISRYMADIIIPSNNLAELKRYD